MLFGIDMMLDGELAACLINVTTSRHVPCFTCVALYLCLLYTN